MYFGSYLNRMNFAMIETRSRLYVYATAKEFKILKSYISPSSTVIDLRKTQTEYPSGA